MVLPYARSWQWSSALSRGDALASYGGIARSAHSRRSRRAAPPLDPGSGAGTPGWGTVDSRFRGSDGGRARNDVWEARIDMLGGNPLDAIPSHEAFVLSCRRANPPSCHAAARSLRPVMPPHEAFVLPFRRTKPPSCHAAARSLRPVMPSHEAFVLSCRRAKPPSCHAAARSLRPVMPSHEAFVLSCRRTKPSSCHAAARASVPPGTSVAGRPRASRTGTGWRCRCVWRSA